MKGEQMKELPALMEACDRAIFNPQDWLRGVRVPPWKYVFAPQNPRIRPELYHLGEDPSEKRNLVDQYPTIADSLRRTIEEIASDDESRALRR